jgi:phosphoribosylformylglycinamidine cyclo-ligase
VSSQYQELGVDPHKANVKKIFAALINNDFPGAFVNIIRDPDVPGQVLTQHQDGDGSKFIQRLLHYDKTKDLSVFYGAADDALAMNSGDIAASGFVFGKWLITDVLNLNLEPEIKEDVMKAIAWRFIELRKIYADHGFNNLFFLGGETADLRDQVRSAVFDVGITAWAQEKDLILGNTRPGDRIYGFASDGQAIWEKEPNSGIMSNGLTLARKCLMSSHYNEEYPQLKRDGDFYAGDYFYNDGSSLLKNMTVGEAIISPTRQWPILIRQIMLNLKAKNALHLLHGVSLNTGGGATKIKNVGVGGMCYSKLMPPPPPIFRLIQNMSGEDWQHMYEDFNMGVGIDVVGEDNPIFEAALKKAGADTNIALYKLGYVRKNAYSDSENKVVLEGNLGTWEY